MKKNVMMRLASFLLVAVLISTSAISGTYAKYVTEDSGSDSARVAKWGITALVEGTLFGGNYNEAGTEETADKISAVYTGSVDSAKPATATADDIVAPGTKSDKGLTLSVTGTPEVNYKVEYATEGTNSDIWLQAGKYGVLVKASNVTADNYVGYYYLDGTTYKAATTDTVYANVSGNWYELHDEADVEENVANTGKYYPVKWYITKAAESTGTLTPAASYATVEDVATALASEFNAADVDSLTETKDIYTVSWSWAFDGQQDDADTILGNIQAAAADQIVVVSSNNGVTYSTLTANTDYCLTIAFGAKLTVTQLN